MQILTANILQMVTDRANITIANKNIKSYTPLSFAYCDKLLSLYFFIIFNKDNNKLKHKDDVGRHITV